MRDMCEETYRHKITFGWYPVFFSLSMWQKRNFYNFPTLSSSLNADTTLHFADYY